jgi:hypothetical protein
MSDTIFLQGVGLEFIRPSVSLEIILDSSELYFIFSIKYETIAAEEIIS